jgi:hypothetical protein
MLFESRDDQFEKGIGGSSDECASLVEGIGPQGALDGVGMQTKFGSDGSDFPMLGVKEATDVGKLFRSNHVSPRFIKRIEKTSAPSTEKADDSSECGEKRPPLRRHRRRDGWRGDDAGSEGRILSLIHNVFFSRDAGQIGLASAVLSLPALLIFSPFRTPPMPAVGGAQLLTPRDRTTGEAAISLAAITVGTDEEEDATL